MASIPVINYRYGYYVATESGSSTAGFHHLGSRTLGTRHVCKVEHRYFEVRYINYVYGILWSCLIANCYVTRGYRLLILSR